MKIKTGIFDLGKTVIDYDWDRAVRILERCHGIDPKRVYGTILHNVAHEGLEGSLYNGNLSPNEFYRASLALFRRQGDSRSPEAPLPHMGEERFWEIFNTIFNPNPPMEKLILRLKKRGYRLVLLTNTCAPHLEFVKKTFRIIDRFDAIVASHEVSLAKPNPAIYALALKAARAKPEECFFVDDLSWNLTYPQTLGIKTFCYDLENHGALLEWMARERIL
ncbi:MAG: HAD-IA family hydrolase [bacterium]|nr:HAD-IA family hydrolase [bacterium]